MFTPSPDPNSQAPVPRRVLGHSGRDGDDRKAGICEVVKADWPGQQAGICEVVEADWPGQQAGIVRC